MAVPPSPLQANPVDQCPADRRRASHFSLSLDRDRASSTIAAIRRGELKISAPIPVGESTGAFFGKTALAPEDAHRAHAPRSVTPDVAPGELTSMRTTSRRPSVQAMSIRAANVEVDGAAGEAEQPDRQEPASSGKSVEGTLEPSANDAASPRNLRRKRSTDDVANRGGVMERQTTPPASVLSSTTDALHISSPSSHGRSSSASKRKNRRSGAFKSVLKRMFTSKRGRSDPIEEEPLAEKASPPKHGYHRSDPGVILEATKSRSAGEADKEKPTTPTPHQRNHSLPIQRVSNAPGVPTPICAHLPFPMNVNAPESSGLGRQRGIVGPDSSSNQRRASLPGAIVTTAAFPSLNPFLDSPRSSQAPDGASDPAQIGLALTTTGLKRKLSRKSSSKRRSRSAGALRDFSHLGHHNSDPRRRSAEIRYWRESYLGTRSGSPAPSARRKKASVSHAETEAMPDRSEAVSIVTENADPPSRDRASRESKERPRSDTKMGDDATEMSEFLQVQEITVEPAGSTDTLHEPEAVLQDVGIPDTGMEEIPPDEAVPRPASPSSITERLEHLERDVRGFERSLKRLTDHQTAEYPTVVLADPPKSLRRSRDPSAVAGAAGDRPVGPDTPPSSSYAETGRCPPVGHEYDVEVSPTTAYAPHSGMEPSDNFTDALPAGDEPEAFPAFSPVFPPYHEGYDTGSVTPLHTAHGPSARYANRFGPIPPSPDIVSHLTPLYEVLKYERMVRKHLEAEMRDLRAEVMSLREFVGRLVNDPASDGAGRCDDRARRDTAWEGHENERERLMKEEKRMRMEEEARRHTSRFSGLDSVDDGEEEDDDEDDEDDDNNNNKNEEVEEAGEGKESHEAFATPSEEREGVMF